MSVFKNFQFKLSISDFQNSEHFIFRTSAKFNFRKFDRVGLRKNIADNGSGLCEVAENRSGKFRFRRQVAKANFYLLNYEKKPIKLAFADYEAQTFNLAVTPPFCKTLVS